MMYEKQCPQCKETTSKFHLMMSECDDCINKICKSKPNGEYINVNGIFIKVLK